MGVVHKRVFYYHADASALGGHFHSPLPQSVPIQVPLSLSPSGGFGSSHSERFTFQELVSFERAYSTVSGQISRETGHYITTATATVEGLNILGVVTADRIVARISSSTPHQAGFYEPSVTMVGSHFAGLQISGCPVTVDIDQGILHSDEPEFAEGEEAEEEEQLAGEQTGFDLNRPKRRRKERLPLVDNPHFIRKIQGQYDRMRDPDALPDWVEDRSIPDWIPERYPSDLEKKIGKRGMIVCSLVKGTSGAFAGTPYGNVFSVPDFGRIFLGEVLVDRNTHRLIMVRVELGCSTVGDASGPAVAIEGRTHP